MMTPSLPIPSADEVIARLRVALAELGYEGMEIWHEGLREDGWPILTTEGGVIPPAIMWTAGELAFAGHIECWSCWSAHTGRACSLGDCSHPDGPAKPPRELLVARAS